MRFAGGESWDVLGGFQLCGRCFEEPAALHQHSSFCMIRGASGEHEPAERPCGLADWHELGPDACVPAPSAPDGTLCAFCFCDFDDPEGDPPCAWPGCTAQPPHFADSTRDVSQGLVHGVGTYAHRNCFGQWFSMKGFGYCGDAIPVLCKACEHEREAAAWRAEFASGAAMAAEAFVGRDVLDVIATAALLRRAEVAMEIAPSSQEAVDAVAAKGDGAVGRSACAELLLDAARRMHPQAWIQRLAQEAIHAELLPQGS